LKLLQWTFTLMWHVKSRTTKFYNRFTMQSYVISAFTLLVHDFWWENVVYKFWWESLLIDLFRSRSYGIQSCPHCFNGVVFCVWSIITHANFLICMLCPLFSVHPKRHSQTLDFLFNAWSFKLTIISLFINITLDFYYQTKKYKKVKKKLCSKILLVLSWAF